MTVDRHELPRNIINHSIVLDVGKGSLTKLFTEVKDSGVRQEWETGAVRDMQKGKGRFDLIPFESLERLAIHFENGAVKYGDSNWQKGIPLRTYLNSAARHLHKLIAGWDDEDHAAAVLWNISCFITTQAMIEGGELPLRLDDLDPKKNWDAPEVKTNE